MAVKKDRYSLQYASKKLLSDRDFMLEMMEEYDKSAWQYAPEPLREELRLSLRQQPKRSVWFD